MKLGYFGSPDLSAKLLAALLADARFQVQFVVSNPDKPRGRSGTARPTEVAELALERGLPLFRFPTLKGDQAAEALAAFDAELYVVFAYGRLLPSAVFRHPPRGTINLHASLLPALRGASPLQTALLEGYERKNSMRAMLLPGRSCPSIRTKPWPS
jgi:methionyl-tRNA formyltransferase